MGKKYALENDSKEVVKNYPAYCVKNGRLKDVEYISDFPFGGPSRAIDPLIRLFSCAPAQRDTHML